MAYRCVFLAPYVGLYVSRWRCQKLFTNGVSGNARRVALSSSAGKLCRVVPERPV